jgi:nicotinamide-nucleotide amidase
LLRRAAIISTGSEILQGLYADTNARYLAEQLSVLGVEVVLSAAAPDHPGELRALLEHAAGRADLVVCSGGLGPTADDVNRDVFAAVWRVDLVRDERAVEMMRERFRVRGQEMPPANEVQALVPAGSTVLHNQWGTAPGFFLPPGAGGVGAPSSALLALPGPPKELIPMFDTLAKPLLCDRIDGATYVRTRTIHTFGRPESELGALTRDLFRRDPAVGFTILAKTYGVDFRVTARGGDRETVDALLDRFERETLERIGPACVYGFDDDTMASAVAALLISAGVSVTVAESCTGGLVTKLLTDIPGSSAYLRQAVVTYANESKMRLLGVRPETLRDHGAVSEACAREMAEGARRAADADYALAITGIAGPSGGTPAKPVGLVFVALASPAPTVCLERRLLGDRELIRLHAALTALDLLRQSLRAAQG